MKKICLIHTSLPKKAAAYWPPVGILHIASSLRKEGHSVFVIDREAGLVKNNLNLDIVDKITISSIKEEKPDYVGITAFTPLISDAYHTAAMIKSLCGDIPIILGGHHATALYRDVLLSDYFDMAVIGEGEDIMSDIASGVPIKEIAGISFKQGGNIIVNSERPPIKDLGRLAPPAWDYIDMDLYTRPSANVIRGYFTRPASVMTSRGCPFRCAYCAGGNAFKYKLNFFPIEYIITEIEDLIKRFNILSIYFLDDQFTANNLRVYELCDRLIETGLSKKIVWAAQVRVDSINLDMLLKMKKAGCIQVEFGFESNSQKILDSIDKRTTVLQNEHAAMLCKKAGIRTLANLMTNFPKETEEDMHKTISFAKKHAFVHISFQKMVPLPATKFWHMLKDSGAINETWERYDTLDLTYNFTDIPEDRFNKQFLKTREWMDRIGQINELKSWLKFKNNRLSVEYIKKIKRYISLWCKHNKQRLLNL